MEDENLDEYEKSQFENGLKLGEQAIRLDEM